MSFRLSRVFSGVARVAARVAPLAIAAFAPGAVPLVRAAFSPAEEAPSSLLDYLPRSEKIQGALQPILKAAYDELGVFRGEGSSLLGYGALKAQQVIGAVGGLDIDEEGYQEEYMEDEAEEE